MPIKTGKGHHALRQATRYCQAWREARALQPMMTVGRALPADVEILAGRERADGISERLGNCLPEHLMATSG